MKMEEKMDKIWLSYRHKVLAPELWDLTELELKKAFLAGMVATLQLEGELAASMFAACQSFIKKSTIAPFHKQTKGNPHDKT